MTEHQKAVDEINKAWKTEKAIEFNLAKKGRQRTETVPIYDCYPPVIRLLIKQGWTVTSNDAVGVEVGKIHSDDMPEGD